MSDAASSRWLWLILIFIIVISSSSSADKMNKTAVSGEKITLPCQALNVNKTINGLEWSRLDMEREYVLMYRDEQSDPTHQHPSFKNRVELQDREMKDGDVSLILKNVTINDTGTYECRVVQGQHDTNRRKRANLDSDPICTFNLSVVPPGPVGALVGPAVDWFGSVGLKVGLSVCGLVAALVVFLIYKKNKQSPGQYQPPAQQQWTETSQTNSQLDCESLSNERERTKSLWVNSLVNSLDRSLQLGEKLQTYKEKILTL